MKKETISADQANLRRLAEKVLEDNADSGDLSEKSTEDIASMFHELRVHQIELEMQNEELKRIQQELEQTKNQYSHLYDFSPAGYLSVSEKGFIEKANLTIATMLGKARGDLIGKPLAHFVHKDDQDILYHHRARLLETKAPQMCELRLLANDGPEFYARLECMIVKNKDAEIGEIRVVVSDVTAIKQTENELRESEAKYRSMMESFADPLYICSPDFTVDYMNPAMIRRVGRDASGEKCYSALHGLDSKCNWCIYDNVKLNKTTETSVKSPLDGRHYRVTNMPIHNNDGTISKMSVFRDITDYIEAVSQKEGAQKKLAQAQKMESLGNLAGGIAHDFNNILASIIGFTELSLDDVEKDSMIEDNLQEVYSAGKRAKDLVSQILAYARQSEVEMKPIQIDMIINEVLHFIRASIPTNIEIIKSIDSDSIIIGNLTQVHQLVMNLCTNAAQSMEDKGGTLEVTLKDFEIDKSFSKKLDLKPGNYIRITVSDTGVGIPPDIIDSIFEPYSTTKNSGEGTGMGLALVQGIVESYMGKIAVKSRPGEGSTFTIYLPVTRKRGIQPQYKPEQSPKGTERILFVDDEASITKMGKHGLERLGYQVTTKTSSVEALELFRSKPDEYDLIITDMTMPNITGDRLAIELMKIRPDIPVILCTGYSKKMSDELASDMGIKALAYKPIVNTDLANTVRKVLDEAKG